MTLVRDLEQTDFDQWLVLWNGYLDFYETALEPEQTRFTFDRLVTRNQGMYGAVAIDASGKAIGLVHWLTHPGTWSANDHCYLEDLYVSPQARGTGAGRALIQHVGDWAAANGASRVYWLTAENNTTAQALYDKVARKTGFIHYRIE